MPIHLPPVSRRKFLAGSLATGVGLLLPRSVWAAGASGDPNRWALLADTHVWQQRDRIYHGVKSVETAAQACRQIAALDPIPAGAIIAGDCAALKGEPGDYGVLAEELKTLGKAAVPVHFALGNHDHRGHFRTAFPRTLPQGKLPVPDKHVSILETPHANWFLLDSLQKTNFTPGRLGEVQLQWLAKALDARDDKPALLVAHHNPDKTAKGSGLQDTEAFFKILAARKQVKAYVFGHTHRWALSVRDGIHLINVPTTAWLFSKAQPRGWVDAKLRPDGATLVLSSLDPKTPQHGRSAELQWRV